MRVIDSICKIISDKYPDIPIHIMEVPQRFKRPCFLVTLATEGSALINLNVYEDTPIYQIVYFGLRNEADQVYPESLYERRAELKALFLLPGAFPVIPLEGVKEKQRYAKTTSFSSDVRLSESCVYVKMGVSFTETARKPEEYELITDIDLEMRNSRNK